MWKGFINIANVSTSLFHIHNYISKVNDDNNNRKWKSFLLPKSKNKIDLTFDEDLNLFYYLGDNENKKPNNEERICLARYTKIIISLEQLSDQIIEATEDILNTNSIYEENKFKEIKNEFLVEFDYYARILRACLKVLAMIYYCLFLIVITSAGVSMMFYACLKRQGYLLTFMHVLWNVIRFFMFSFFLYGTAYGIGFLAIGDSIAYMMYVFNENLAEDKPKLIAGGKQFFTDCLLENDSNLKKYYDKRYAESLNDFFINYKEIKESKCDYENIIQDALTNLENSIDSTTGENLGNPGEFNYLVNIASKEGGLFGSFDCGFLKSHLNLLYTALYDASVESRILSALSLISSFFGAVTIYFFLLVMHHYNNELFFDTGKSIFTGFDGFGGGYKKKDKDKDPAYKKRKLRAEIELTSKNDEQSGYNDVRKNEAEED